MRNSCAVQLRSASPNRTLTPDGGEKAAICSQHTAFNYHRWVCISSCWRHCAHKHRFPALRSGCVFLVCVVWRRRNAGAGAPFHTSSLTDERHDTVAARGLDYLYIYSFSSAPSTDDPPPNLRIAPHFPPLQSTALACFVSFYTIHSIHCILTHCIPAVVHSM